MPDRTQDRRRMVEVDIAGRGIGDAAVLAAMGEVPRERFVPAALAEAAYDDGPLPIGRGQTISQPYVVALMVEAAALDGAARVLEIGTGSGYAAAVMARIGKRVYTVERDAALARGAQERLAGLGYGNVELRCADGTQGWPEAQPFDAIIVAAAAPAVPQPLCAQLAVGGRLIVPVGSTLGQQSLMRVTRAAHGFDEENLGLVAFVPLVGEHGW